MSYDVIVTNDERRARRKSIAEIISELPPDKKVEAEEAIDRYIRLVVRIFRRIEADPEEYKRLVALTDEARARRMKRGRHYKP